MAKITEDYVSFETAKLLKEKGFDEPCKVWYAEYTSVWGGDSSGDRTYNVIQFDDHNRFEDGYKFLFYVPTLQMAMKWLLKKHNIFICPLFLEESNGFGYTIENIIKKEYITTSKNSSYKEPEEACETAIKYCLENLI